MEVQNSNWSRWLGVFFLLVIAMVGVISGDPKLAAILLLWWLFGIKKVETGSQGEATFLGSRTGLIVEDGLRWLPWPLLFLPHKLRAQVRDKKFPLDGMEFTTSDGVIVKVEEGQIMYQIFDMEKRNKLAQDEGEMLDPVIDQGIRIPVARTTYREVLGMEFKPNATLEEWGIRVKLITISKLGPTDPKVREAQSLGARERMEQEGDEIEVRNAIERYKELVAGGFPPAEAVRQVQMTLGKASKSIIDVSGGSPADALVARFLNQVKEDKQ